MKNDTSVIGQLQKIIRPNDERFRFKFYVFLVCLVISIFLWFLIALSRESVSTLNYPITYKNLPGDLMLINHPDSILTFRVASGGFEMITLKYLTRKRPIEIDLSNLNLEKNGEFYTANYSTSRISQELLVRDKFAEELVSISPESLFFKFEPLMGKKVPVIPEVALSFNGLYRLADSIKVIPDSVLVIGAKNLLDKVDFVRTFEKEVKNIDGPLTVMADLQVPKGDQQLKLLPDKVELSINAEKFTEATIELLVETDQPDIRVKSFPDRIKVTYLVSLKNYNRIKEDMFRAVVQIPDDRSVSMVPVKISLKPSFTEIVSIEPDKVEYLVLSND